MPRCALRAERCPEMRRKNIHKSNLAVARTSEMSEIRPTCPKFAPHAEIRVSAPRFALQRHRVMTNLPTFFLSLPLEIPSFFGTLIEICIYHIYITFNTPLYFGRRNTRLGYFLGHFRCSSDRQIRFVYIFKNIHILNLVNARTSEMSWKVPEPSVT